MATTVYIPLALSTVNIADANAYWTAVDGTNFDYGVYAFVSKSTGTMTFEGIVPQNVDGTPSWDVVLYHKTDTGTSGTVAITATAAAYTSAENFDIALTSLTLTKSTNTSTQVTVSLLNGGSLDGTLTLAAGDKFILQISRGGTASTDTLVSVFHLIGPPALKINVA